MVGKKDNHTALSSTKRGLEWLSQFSVQDQADAHNLLKAVRWVSENEFSKAIRGNIEKYAGQSEGPVALFIERELRRPRGTIQRFYKESDFRPIRAYGAALQPVESTRTKRREIGSEGVLATIATGVVRSDPSKYFLNPSIEEIRSNKIRSFLIVTDTVGSGNQASQMLDSMWKVSTIRSWCSGKFIRFGIVAFSVTELGKSVLESHPSMPKVVFSIYCPTIASNFVAEESKRMFSLCSKYNPIKDNGSWDFLGYGGHGVLIAYAHGVPNNAPNILHKRSARWMPLFPKRTTVEVLGEMNTGEFVIDGQAVLKRMGQARLAASKWLSKMDDDGLNMVLIMSSLRRPRAR